MMAQVLRVLPIALVVLLLGGCQAPATLDARDQKTLTDSMQRMAAHAHDKKAFEDDVAFFDQQYFKRKPDAGIPDWHAVDRMTQTDFQRFVADIRKHTAPPRPVPEQHPVADVTLGILHSLEMQVALLKERRQLAHDENRYTIDQFQWAQPFFTAPKVDDSVLDSRATFQMSFTNRTEFDVYAPTLHLTITKPGSGLALYDEDLKTDYDDTIKPGKPVLLTYYCCDLLKLPDDNKLIRTLPGNAELHYAITAVKDYTNADQLDHQYFILPHYHMMVDAEACAADIRKRIDTWTPATALAACARVNDPAAAKQDKRTEGMTD